MAEQQMLSVTVISPRATLFSGAALAISSKNSQGKFDILPQHANFITFVENSPITIIKPDQQKVAYNFPFGIIYVSNNKVSIYAEPESIAV